MTLIERLEQASGRVLRRIICLVRGHDYSVKVVDDTGFCQVTLETCDRCGDGEAEFSFCRGMFAALRAKGVE